MAGRTDVSGVPSGRDRKPRVAEGRLRPGRVRRLVALIAGRRVPGRRMVGIRRPVVKRPVAAVAVARRPLVNAVEVAGRASQRRMDPDQGVRRGVVERRLRPGRVRRLMALIAGRRVTRRRMIGLRRPVIERPVAAVAVARSPFVDSVSVAGRAGLRGVDADQGV